ncbi:MAG: hypothetical protein A3B14_01680 [Candidatus Zambryskibacteria bacterium RIFCSPLOWO2_01_FULL_45_21]|uniref:SET domain-containing protein n=1 Tax=Candidatus Zambryskibacteria bacterium RIFCSPLOWO2_01_FULL_45_21 TaxID=1802761 RepID=A0A1G2U6X2_9BACT|nr:MAG: hypothetical protein A3B14_01680 [Candidatus Zambryskibacteria bacterium RIFCSPLOWO2_01_FULL_45_21]
MEGDLVVGNSRNGKGVFASRKFFIGEKIFEIRGNFVDCYECDELDEKKRSNTFRFNKEKYISPEGELGDFINHSCNPNSRVVKIDSKLFIEAIEDIVGGEEITFDYSTILASDDIWEMKCNCGSKNCRGLIKSFHSLPEQTKQKYITLNMVPDYSLE